MARREHDPRTIDEPRIQTPPRDLLDREERPRPAAAPTILDRQPLRFKVMHGAVGRFLQGAIVDERELGPGCDLDRLVNLGALLPITPDPMDAIRADLAMTKQVETGGMREIPAGWDAGKIQADKDEQARREAEAAEQAAGATT